MLVNKKKIIGILLFALAISSASATTDGALPPTANDLLTPYYDINSAEFNFTQGEFYRRFNNAFPQLSLPKYKKINPGRQQLPHLSYAASKINHYLYSSIVIDNKTKKVKTIQITYIPTPANLENNIVNQVIDSNSSRETEAIFYISALMRWFNPSLSESQSQQWVIQHLNNGSGLPFYQQTSETLRYVVADHGENGLTFAIEPIKQELT